MPHIAGVTTKKDFKGNITHVTSDAKKQNSIISPIPEKLGVVAKSKFDIDCEKAISVEEAREMTLKFVRSLPWKPEQRRQKNK